MIDYLNFKRKGKTMEKTVLLIRHPSVVWSKELFEKAELENKDAETYVPIDEMGWEMVKHLSGYLKSYLPQILYGRTLGIFTSPLKRARDMANKISQDLLVQPQELDYFIEVPVSTKAKDVLAIIEAAEKRGVHPAKLWFEENEKQDEFLEKLNYHLSLLIKGLGCIEGSATSVDIVFSHRATIALTLWLIQERNKGRENLTITEKDISAISAIGGKIAYTSVSQIELRAKRWDVISIAQVPHLEGKPKLVRGTF